MPYFDTVKHFNFSLIIISYVYEWYAKVFLVITRLRLENVEIIHRNFSSCYFGRLSTLLSGNITYVRVR